MVNKKELIKEAKKECSVELDVKKLNKMSAEQLQGFIDSEERLLKGEGWREVINKKQ
jgi:hypothetical protein